MGSEDGPNIDPRTSHDSCLCCAMLWRVAYLSLIHATSLSLSPFPLTSPTHLLRPGPASRHFPSYSLSPARAPRQNEYTTQAADRGFTFAIAVVAAGSCSFKPRAPAPASHPRETDGRLAGQTRRKRIRRMLDTSQFRARSHYCPDRQFLGIQHKFSK